MPRSRTPALRPDAERAKSVKAVGDRAVSVLSLASADREMFGIKSPPVIKRWCSKYARRQRRHGVDFSMTAAGGESLALGIAVTLAVETLTGREADPGAVLAFTLSGLVETVTAKGYEIPEHLRKTLSLMADRALLEERVEAVVVDVLCAIEVGEAS